MLKANDNLNKIDQFQVKLQSLQNLSSLLSYKSDDENERKKYKKYERAHYACFSYSNLEFPLYIDSKGLGYANHSWYDDDYSLTDKSKFDEFCKEIDKLNEQLKVALKIIDTPFLEVKVTKPNSWYEDSHNNMVGFTFIVDASILGKDISDDEKLDFLIDLGPKIPKQANKLWYDNIIPLLKKYADVREHNSIEVLVEHTAGMGDPLSDLSEIAKLFFNDDKAVEEGRAKYSGFEQFTLKEDCTEETYKELCPKIMEHLKVLYDSGRISYGRAS
jgi:hypothetical protein